MISDASEERAKRRLQAALEASLAAALVERDAWRRRAEAAESELLEQVAP